MVSTNTLTTFMTDEGNNIPAFQTLFNYALLCLIFTPYTIYRYGFKKWFKVLYKDGWKYFLLAFADVEGNYFVVKAYQYTNMLSAALLDNFAIVVVVILSFIFLKVRYHWTQLTGIVVCIGGMALLVVSDVLTDKDGAATDMVKGDLFVLLGAACYGVSNTLEEFFVSKRPIYEVVGQLGFWAIFINGVQCAIFERDSIRDAHWNPAVGGYLIGYTLSLLLLYCTAPILFRMSSAAFYNLSLLTSDFWSLLIGIRVFGYFVYWLYPIGFVLIILGMIVYYISFKNDKGEAEKPWLGEHQQGGVVGVGTAKRHEDESINSETALVDDSQPQYSNEVSKSSPHF
jgi:solute carrier family 35 protein F1/2